MITEACVIESNENISIYGLISSLRKTNNGNKQHMTMPPTQFGIQSEKVHL